MARKKHDPAEEKARGASSALLGREPGGSNTSSKDDASASRLAPMMSRRLVQAPEARDQEGHRQTRPCSAETTGGGAPSV